MNRWIIRPALATAIVACAAVASAQQSEMQGAFRVGTAKGWTIGPPQVDLDGGLLSIQAKGASPKVQEAFVSLRVQAGTFVKHVQLAGNVLFARRAAGPQFTTVVQSTQLSNQGHFFLGIGVGGVVASGDGNNMHGWAQGVFAVRTSIYDVAPFVQFGKSFASGSRAEWQVGAAHPLAPYKFHR